VFNELLFGLKIQTNKNTIWSAAVIYGLRSNTSRQLLYRYALLNMFENSRYATLVPRNDMPW